MSRLISVFLEYVNIVTAILVIMGIAALLTLVVGDPNRNEGLFLNVLIGLIVIAFFNGIVAALMSMKRHLADIRNNEMRHLELIRTIADMNVSIDLDLQKRQDLKYPTTDL